MNISHDLRVRNLYPIADSGTTLNNFFMNSPSDYEKRIKPIRALLPDGNKINAHIQCQIKTDRLPEQLKTVYKFDKITELLMPIPVICDNGYTFTFTKQSVHVNKEGETILTGYRESVIKLWSFQQAEKTPPSGQQVELQINTIIPDGTMSDNLNFLHRSMGSPTKTTVLNAIQNNNLIMRPLLP